MKIISIGYLFASLYSADLKIFVTISLVSSCSDFLIINVSNNIIYFSSVTSTYASLGFDLNGNEITIPEGSTSMEIIDILTKNKLGKKENYIKSNLDLN